MDAAESIRFMGWLGLAFAVIALIAFSLSRRRRPVRTLVVGDGLAILGVGVLALGVALESDVLRALGSLLAVIVAALMLRRFLRARRELEP